MTKEKQSKWKNWMAKMGFAGFLFFLIKGLLWLIIPYVLASGYIQGCQ